MIKPMDIKDFENWGTFVIQVIYHLNGGYPFKEGMIRRIKIKSSQFYSSKANLSSFSSIYKQASSGSRMR